MLIPPTDPSVIVPTLFDMPERSVTLISVVVIASAAIWLVVILFETIRSPSILAGDPAVGFL